MGKRAKAIKAILKHCLIATGVSVVPTPGAEGTKSIPLSVNEVQMCVKLARIYSGTALSKEHVKELLVEGGIALSAGAGGALVATKIGKAVADEVLNFAGPLGWMLKGGLATTLTAGVGVAFASFCEARFGDG